MLKEINNYVVASVLCEAISCCEGIASGEEQERPRNDICTVEKKLNLGVDYVKS